MKIKIYLNLNQVFINFIHKQYSNFNIIFTDGLQMNASDYVGCAFLLKMKHRIHHVCTNYPKKRQFIQPKQ